MLLCLVKFFLLWLCSVYASKPLKTCWCQVDVIMPSFLKNGVVKPIIGIAPAEELERGYGLRRCFFAVRSFPRRAGKRVKPTASPQKSLLGLAFVGRPVGRRGAPPPRQLRRKPTEDGGRGCAPSGLAAAGRLRRVAWACLCGTNALFRFAQKRAFVMECLCLYSHACVLVPLCFYARWALFAIAHLTPFASFGRDTPASGVSA